MYLPTASKNKNMKESIKLDFIYFVKLDSVEAPISMETKKDRNIQKEQLDFM